MIYFSVGTLKALVTRARHDFDLHDKFVKTFLCAHCHVLADRDTSTALQVVASEQYGKSCGGFA
jgi:hypothetical protein